MATLTDDAPRCALCGNLWHPASGMVVGSPSEYLACGRCWRDLQDLVKDTMPRQIRISTSTRDAWKAAPKADRGPRPWISFYDAAASSIGAFRR